MITFLSKLIGVSIMLASLGGAWLSQDFRQFIQKPLSLPTENAALTVERGTNIRALSAQLEDMGWLQRAEYFEALARLNGQAGSIKAGEYYVDQGIGAPALLDLLVEGKVVQHSLTLVEGLTFREALKAVRANAVLKQTLADADDKAIMTAIGYSQEHPEGRFFADTYNFPRGMSDQDFLRRAYQTMEKVLAEEWENRAENLPLKTPYEALILASIIEKETAVPAERPQIAGVFVRRLKKGMRLQTDPTVIYGLGEAFDGNLRRRDLRSDTPYNSYTRHGLPPTPIALVGREALHAALHPADGKSLYFVAKGDGTHYFSATLKEHNRAVRKYQLSRRSR